MSQPVLQVRCANFLKSILTEYALNALEWIFTIDAVKSHLLNAREEGETAGNFDSSDKGSARESRIRRRTMETRCSHCPPKRIGMLRFHEPTFRPLDLAKGQHRQASHPYETRLSFSIPAVISGQAADKAADRSGNSPDAQKKRSRARNVGMGKTWGVCSEESGKVLVRVEDKKLNSVMVRDARRVPKMV